MKKTLLFFALTIFQISYSQIVTIPDANFKAALIAEGVDINNDGEIQVSEAEAVTELNIVNRNISSLEGIVSFINLIKLSCARNNLTELDVSSLLNLTLLDCSMNEITELDVSMLSSLTTLSCSTNQLTSLNISGLSSLTTMNCSRNNLSSLDGSGLVNLWLLYCSSNQLTTIDISNNVDLELFFIGDNMLTTLDVSHLSKLRELQCNTNQLNSLGVDGLNNLTSLVITENNLSSLDVSGLNNLKRLQMGGNLFTSSSQIINLSDLSDLEQLIISDNLLTELDVLPLANLTYLKCDSNQLSTLDLTSLTKLSQFWCDNNQLSTLDVTTANSLAWLYANNNQLESLFMKNGSNESRVHISGNPNLQFICVDTNELEFVQQEVDENNYTNCVVNSFCTFEPGGEVFYVEGNVKVDLNANGCDSNDINFPFLQLKVTDTNNNTGVFSTDTNGNYDIALPEGSYTVEYQFPYMSYFDITPASFSVNFPADTSPVNQDICLTPNGTYNDLQVVIIPLEEARPGFDARYKIIYANVGTTPLSGNVQFTFQENVLDYVSSSVSPDTQNTGELNWLFSNLAPLEFKFIEVTMNLNAPTETPSLNGGEVLCYDALITPVTNDQKEDDNSFTLKQTVVNSYDPNDKTCLEGNTVTPGLIGEYVHYLIRFENTGTASAINVVVKDVIDTAKFDISSLVIYDSSHDMVTRIQNTNEVEFIFEGINLPFDDANNDGYIAFKIKTLPSLVVGDTFENTAEIYFDFNFPIITNTEQTTIDNTASVDDIFATANMRVFPNPVNALFTIESSVSFDSLAIYDLKGRQLQLISSTTPQLTKQIDLSNFASGIYYVSVQSGTAKKLLKIIRE